MPLIAPRPFEEATLLLSFCYLNPLSHKQR
jgi:hypothetical protein